METEPIPVIREISRADIPRKCLAKVFWVDDNSYVYIGLFCPILQEEFHAAMAAATRGGPRLPSHVREGAHVIIMDADQVRNTYARGVVLKINHSNYTVKCLLIDECREIDVNCMKIYPTTNHVLSFPNFCIKGQLKDLECFIDCPFVKYLFKHHLESLGKTELDLGVCFMSISNPLQQTPTLEITFPGQESTFNSTLQSYIPSLGKMIYPPVAAATKMTLTYVSTDGDVWVQEYSNFSLINVVKKLLAGFDPKRSPQLAYQVKDEDCVSSKEQYFFGEGRIFVAKHCSDGKFHRVKVNPGNDAANGPTVTVSYIDYGHDDVVQRKNLHAAYLIDPNLCFIPPQCIPMKFSGAKYAERPFNQERFLKYIIHQPISIYLLNEPNADGSSFPEGDVLARSMFSRRSHPGYSLEQVYKMNAVANSTSSGVEMSNLEPLENGSQSHANHSTDENQDANHV